MRLRPPRFLVWLRPPRLHTKSAVCCDVHNGNIDRPSSSAGRDLLCGHLLTLPDNKIVEDIHQPIRLQSLGHVNRKQRAASIQNTIANSGVLEQRDVPDAGAVEKEHFLSEFKNTPNEYSGHIYRARTHKLPEAFASMMQQKKTWASWSE